VCACVWRRASPPALLAIPLRSPPPSPFLHFTSLIASRCGPLFVSRAAPRSSYCCHFLHGRALKGSQSLSGNSSLARSIRRA